MPRFAHRPLCFLGAAGVALAVLAAGPASAAASGTYTCSGTPSHPGVLAGGTYDSVVVQGVCFVNQGPVLVVNNVVVLTNGALAAAFALNDKTGTGHSRLSVDGNVLVEQGATLVLGCIHTSFGCIDDPNPSSPTLASPGLIAGNLEARSPLGVLVHNSSIGGSVQETLGGGGVNCTPSGIFAAFQSPVYSDYEDSHVGSSLTVSGLSSCWLAVARVRVGGNLTFANDKLNDPDAIEILRNYVSGNPTCSGNSAVWDSSEQGHSLYPRTPEPNFVGGHRHGQCVLASSTTAGGTPGPGAF